VLLFAALAIIGSEYAANVRRQIIWQYPGTAQAHLGMANAGWKMGNREQAMEDFRQAQFLSRVYESEELMTRAMIFAQDQLVVFRELIHSATD